MQSFNTRTAYTTVFPQKFNPELRLIGFLQGAINL